MIASQQCFLYNQWIKILDSDIDSPGSSIVSTSEKCLTKGLAPKDYYPGVCWSDNAGVYA